MRFSAGETRHLRYGKHVGFLRPATAGLRNPTYKTDVRTMSDKPVLIIQNHPIETPGRIGDYLTAHDIPYHTAHAYNNDTLPTPDLLRAIIMLGCPSSVAEFQREGWSKRLFDYLDEIVTHEIPYLGICYGAQLMAANRGAAVLPVGQKEIGVYDVTLTTDGRNDPLFAGFPETFPVFHWHGDMFDIAESAQRLATAEICQNQAYRIRNCWGIQFHLEADPQKLPVWVKEYASELPEVNKTAEEVLTEFTKVEAETKRLSDLLLGNFLGMIQ